MHIGPAGFSLKRSCVDVIYVYRNELVQGRVRVHLFIFLDIRRAYNSVWQNGLWGACVQGIMWRVGVCMSLLGVLCY